MYSNSYNSQTGSQRDQISEEEYNGPVSEATIAEDPLFGITFDGSILDNLFDDYSITGQCDVDDLMNAIDRGGSDTQAPNAVLQHIEQAFPILDADHVDYSSTIPDNVPQQLNPVELSESVAVGRPSIEGTHSIKIKHELEESFRPRYKSDYFGMNGKTRKPRYVADRAGNHFITLELPKGLVGQIRVDWLTTELADEGHFSMPYRFQISNDSSDIPDQNPAFFEIPKDHTGTMKLYLVLIKATQGELKQAQPLKPFCPWIELFGADSDVGKTKPMTPKDLIQHYQLQKSQLAFTYCTVVNDSKEVIPEWNTTVMSTVLTELPPENAKPKINVKCPHCSHEFDLSEQDSQKVNVEEQPTVSKRKMKPNSPSSKKMKLENVETFPSNSIDSFSQMYPLY